MQDAYAEIKLYELCDNSVPSLTVKSEKNKNKYFLYSSNFHSLEKYANEICRQVWCADDALRRDKTGNKQQKVENKQIECYKFVHFNNKNRQLHAS